MGALFLLIWRMNLLVVWFLIFVLHDFRGIKVPIGGLHCETMNYYCYLKVGSPAHGNGEKTMTRRRAKYLMFD